MSFGIGNTTGMAGDFLSNAPVCAQETRPMSQTIACAAAITDTLRNCHRAMSRIEEVFAGPQQVPTNSKDTDKRVPSIVGSLDEIGNLVMLLNQRMAEFEKRI